MVRAVDRTLPLFPGDVPESPPPKKPTRRTQLARLGRLALKYYRQQMYQWDFLVAVGEIEKEMT